MGHESHPVSSPAHRRNQSPASPSGSAFRRSSAFSRDEIDLSWMALIRRHRFLLSMLLLLMFLCTIYLYFAIKLGKGDCSGLVGNEETLCQLKKSNVKASHVLKASRRLFNIHESAVELQNHHEVGKNKSVLIWGCIGDDMVAFLNTYYDVSTLILDCQVLKDGDGKIKFNYQNIGSRYSSNQFESLVRKKEGRKDGPAPCHKCTLLQLQVTNDQDMLLELEYLFENDRYFFSIFDDSTHPGFNNNFFSKWSSA